MSDIVGYVVGELTLTIEGGDPFKLGTVDLPVVLTAIRDQTSASGLAFGLGVNLDDVKNTIGIIFRDAKVKENDS